VKLFRKPNSRFYWYDFTVRGHRYRRSTQETKLARAAKAASVKLGSVIEGTDPFPSKPSVLSDFAERFDTWVEDGRLEKKTKKFYRNGWRLLKATPVAGLRVDQITGDFAELFRDIVILMRDTGMRNERELFRMRIENLDWQNRVIFVPDSKTAEGRRLDWERARCLGEERFDGNTQPSCLASHLVRRISKTRPLIGTNLGAAFHDHQKDRWQPGRAQSASWTCARFPE
jgi:hypothetical protein